DLGLTTRIVAGQANPNLSDLRRRFTGMSGVELLVDVADMGAQMQWADIAVAAAGSTAWELAYLATPSILIPLAPNQEPIARELERHGAAAYATLDTLPEVFRQVANDADLRRAYSERARTIVDGQGASRVVATIRSGAR